MSLHQQLLAAGKHARDKEWEQQFQPRPAFKPLPPHNYTLDVEWLGNGTVRGTWKHNGVPVYSAIYDGSYDLIQKLEGTGNAPDTATSPGAVDTAAGHGKGT